MTQPLTRCGLGPEEVDEQAADFIRSWGTGNGHVVTAPIVVLATGLPPLNAASPPWTAILAEVGDFRLLVGRLTSSTMATLRRRMERARPPILYKYLDVKGAAALLWHRQFWYRCPLHPNINDAEDSQADLLEHLDVVEVRRAYRDELVRLLCEPTVRPASPGWVQFVRQASKHRGSAWTPAEVDEEFGVEIEGLMSNLESERRRIREALRTELRALRILCLSEDPASTYMWERYGGSSAGACIGFRYVPEIDNAIGAAKPVVYAEHWPSIATPLEFARHGLGIEEIPFGKRALEGLFVKRNKWRFEREWRILNKPKPDSAADEDGVLRITIDPAEVAEIFLGPAMSAEHREAIQMLSEELYPHATTHVL